MQDVEPHHVSEAVSQAERPEGWVARSHLLDRPSDPHPILTILMGNALHSILLTADGRTQSIRHDIVSGSRNTTNEPTSDLAAILDDLEHHFTRAQTHRRRLMLIKEAQELSARLRYAPDRSKVRNTPEWKQAIINDPRSCRVLESVYGVSYSTISRIKKQGVARVAHLTIVA